MDYREIELTRGYKAKVSKEDYERVSEKKWHVCGKEPYLYAASGHKTSKKRVAKGYKSTNTYTTLHRFITNAGEGSVVDHINKDTLDNRRSNLRVCSHSQNLFNSKFKAVEFKGVRKHKSRDCFEVFINDIVLTGFCTKSDAARAYDQIAKKLYGEFAHLNNVGNKIF